MSDKPAIDETVTHPLFVVGIGASAGGLQAIEEVLKNVVLDHMAFVVVQHLSPTHESMLTQLLSRVSAVEVVTATDGAKLEKNHVYVVPPNSDLAVSNGVLRLTPQTSGPRLPIDFFFRSLADDFGPQAVGIVLSGTGTDGTFGLTAIKAAGGITLVQEPSTAKFEGMPQSALASGSADFSLSPANIAQELKWIGTRTSVASTRAPSAEATEQYAKLFASMRTEFGNDLTQYKPATVQRRVERRMALTKMASLEDYVRAVQANPVELRSLYQDMLISVTRFFRDRDPFIELQAQVLPRVVTAKRPLQPLRVWVPACATGEEVYSLAIVILEFLEQRGLELPVQLFGTDVDEAAIDVARRGLYPRNIALDVSSERLAKYFVEAGDQYQISPRVRALAVFSRHNLYRDPPFTRIDLVSCRNVLIYLQPATQKRVLRALHHSLVSGGFLMLGTSETVGDAPELFSLTDRKNKLYAKNATPGFGALEVGYGTWPSVPAAYKATARVAVNPQAVADRKVLELYAPGGVIVDEKLQVLNFRGRTGRYLEPAMGTATLELTRVVRAELRSELKRTVQQALDTQQRVQTDVTWTDAEKRQVTRLDAIPLPMPAGPKCCLVLFVDVAPQSLHASRLAEGSIDPRLAALEHELASTRESVQAALDERAAAEEEFKFANEELQSTNEELQSTNEELETSKEELQSTNEELVTVNDELQSRMKELTQTNDDLHNVLLGVDQAVVIVGPDLRIRRFTMAAEKLFNLVAGDVGRAVGFLERFVGACQLTDKVNDVLHTLVTTETHVLASNHRWYDLKVAPYKTVDHVVRGAIITVGDIDVRKKASALGSEVGDYAARYLAAVEHPLLIVDRRLRVVWANAAFYGRFQSVAEEVIGLPLMDLGDRSWFDAPLRDRLAATLEKGVLFRDVPVTGLLRDDPGKTLKLGGSRPPVSVDTPMALLSLEER